MPMFGCFSVITQRKVKNNGNDKSFKRNFNTLLAKLQNPRVSSETRDLEQTTFDAVQHGMQKNSRYNVKVMSLEGPVKAEVEEAYEGEDRNDNSSSMDRELSDIVLQGHEAGAGKEGYDPTDGDMNYHVLYATDEPEEQIERYSQKSGDLIQSGHVSDPGIGKSDFLASPKLKRSCSNLENRNVHREITHYFQELSVNPMGNFQRSGSVMSHCSADRVMLKRHSSGQVLPSGSKKLWWKLFMWSHRNTHRMFSGTSKPVPASALLSSQCGYSSDTLEPKRINIFRHVESSRSTTQSFDKISCVDDQRQSRFQNQWFSFSTESTALARVDAWVKGLEIQEPLPEDDFDDDNAKTFSYPSSPERRSTSLLALPDTNLSKEILNANSVVQSLDPSSSVAHISGFAIKAIPVIPHLSNLRSVTLSNNFIVTISPGCLPKSVQTLDLSRNKINTLDGLRELTRLRVLDLSFNRISRLGQGLSSCTLIKELYLAGNKISDVEGLHRLFKLAVVDLSFNKITTTKALGQLVANYNSLQALNLLGNPIQRNISNEQLNKSVCGLLPKLVYLNKQPVTVKAQRTREILTVTVPKAALGDRKRSSERRSLKRVSQGGLISSRGHKSSEGVSQKTRNRTRR